MRRNFIVRGDYVKGARSSGDPDAEPEGVDRPGAAADLAQAVPDRLRRDPLGLAGRRLEVLTERQAGGKGGRVRAAGAVRGAVGVPLARDLDERVAVVEHVDRL